MRRAKERNFDEIGLPDAIRSDDGSHSNRWVLAGSRHYRFGGSSLVSRCAIFRRPARMTMAVTEHMHRTLKAETSRPAAATPAEQQRCFDRFRRHKAPYARHWRPWGHVLFVLLAYRLLSPGSDWRLYRLWFKSSALDDLLGADSGIADIHKLYECHDRLLEHKLAAPPTPKGRAFTASTAACLSSGELYAPRLPRCRI